MSDQDIARAWKDKKFRNSLSAEEKGQIPENPAGDIVTPDQELDDQDLEQAQGASTGLALTAGCCYQTTIFCTGDQNSCGLNCGCGTTD